MADVSPENERDLAALGRIVARMSSGHPESCLADILDHLRRSCGVEIAEVFLAEPQSGHLVLSMFQGPFQSAFAAVDRFAVGEGFPGLVAQSGQPLVSRRLADDGRFLRQEVKDLGFQTLVSAPLRGVGGVMGVLQVGSRRRDVDVERVLRLTTWAAAPLGTLVESMFFKARLAVVPVSVEPRPAVGVAPHVQHVVRAMMTVTGAEAGVLTLLSGENAAPVQCAIEGAGATPSCLIGKEGLPAACPALDQGRGIALSGSPSSWPLDCRDMPARCGLVQCVPLVSGGRPLGVAQLQYRKDAGLLPGRHLPTLLHMASEAAGFIDAAQPAIAAQVRTEGEVTAPVQERCRSSRRVPIASVARPALLQKVDPRLDVRCLGQFYIEHGGMQITPQMVQRRGALSLLKLLLRRPGQVLSRDALAEAMWLELDPRLGAQRLYVLVHALRQTIEPPGQGRQWLFVRNEGDSYYFNTEAPYALDVQEFRASVRQGEKAEAGGRVAEAIASYETAVDLYRGDYLEDEPYADWAAEERERLRELYLVALDRLAERYRKAGAVERSIACYQRSLHADALREKTCRDLMLALWQAGRRVEALRTYEAFSSALDKELGIRPMRDTQDLYACIRVDSG